VGEPEIRARRADAADVRTLRRFRCNQGGWFARDVQRLVRGKVASAVDSIDPVHVVLFERGREVVAVAAFEIREADPVICDLHVVAIANEHQGSRVNTPTGRHPLVRVVLDTALDLARELGATRAEAIVARSNARSVRMLLREGFVRVRSFDRDYDEYIARLA